MHVSVLWFVDDYPLVIEHGFTMAHFWMIYLPQIKHGDFRFAYADEGDCEYPEDLFTKAYRPYPMQEVKLATRIGHQMSPFLCFSSSSRIFCLQAGVGNSSRTPPKSLAMKHLRMLINMPKVQRVCLPSLFGCWSHP